MLYHTLPYYTMPGCTVLEVAPKESLQTGGAEFFARLGPELRFWCFVGADGGRLCVCVATNRLSRVHESSCACAACRYRREFWACILTLQRPKLRGPRDYL